jgi:hypothetical protein
MVNYFWTPIINVDFQIKFLNIISGYIHSQYFISEFRWKKYITMLQLVQFIVLFVHSMLLVVGAALDLEYSKCGYPWQYSGFSVIMIYGPMFLLFSKFYTTSYSQISSKKGK